MDLASNKGNLEMSITFLGAVGGAVTGSRVLVTVTRRGTIIKKLLIDCGGFQGKDEEYNLTSVIPEDVDFVFLTHAHFDHCGYCPVLYKEGYVGGIYASMETLRQAEEIMRDSAYLNLQQLNFRLSEIKKMEKVIEKEVSKALRKDVSRKDLLSLQNYQEEIEDEKAMVPYLPEDVNIAAQHFMPIPVNTEVSVCEGIYVKLIPSSHINGATMIEVYATHGAEKCAIAFSGDVGKETTMLYKKFNYEQEPDVDFLVLESLHGTQELQTTLEESIDEVHNIIKKGLKKKKNIVLGLFSLDRSAMFIPIMNRLMNSGASFYCGFDMPLGQRELSWYMHSYATGKSEWFDYEKEFPFDLERIHIALDHEQHINFVKKEGPNVFLTSSCMGTGGRIVDYFHQHIQDENTIFIFPGFLPEDSPSKILCDTPKGTILEFQGEHYVKHCETYHLEGFSSHGYFEDKLKILQRYPNLKTIFLNHGDADSIQELYEELPNYTRAKIYAPNFNDSYDLMQIIAESERDGE